MKKKKEIIIDIVLVIAIGILVVPFAITILYSLPSTDDFGMALLADKENLLQSAIAGMKYFYMNWAGDWPNAFLQVLLNPITLFGATSKMIGVELLSFFVLFLITLYVAIYSFSKRTIGCKGQTIPLLLTLLVLVGLLNIDIWTEIFYWFVGASYLWGVTAALLTIHLEVKYFEEQKMRDAILLAVVGFFACTSYSTAVVPCFIYLVYAIRAFVLKKGKIVPKLVPFACMLIGAFSALVAPGNYVRSSSDIGMYSLVKALKDTFIIWMDSLFDLVKMPLFIIVIIGFVLVGMKKFPKEKLLLGHPLIPLALSGICMYINYYPFALGYGNAMYLPNRARFVFSIYAILLFAASAVYLGAWIADKKPKYAEKENIVKVCAGLVVFSYLCFIPTQLYEELPYTIVVDQKEEVKELNEEWIFILSQIENSTEENFVWSRSWIDTIVIKQPGFHKAADGGVSSDIIKYFGKESITIEWW